MNSVRLFVALTACLTATSALAQLECSDSTLKIATLAPERHTWVQDLRKGAREIKERTEGRVTIKLYVGGVMGDDEQVLRRIKTRQLHGAAFTPMGLQEIYADANIYGLPFMFRSEDEVDYVRQYIDEKLFRGLKENGFVTLGWSNGGFAYLMSNEPVRGLDDLDGKKVWVPEKDFFSYATMEALELSPVVLPMTDVLPGLERGLLDVVAFPPATTIALQWHTKVKYITEMPILFSMGLFAVENKAFEKLCDQDQQILKSVIGDMFDKISERSRQFSLDAKEALHNAGIQSVMPAAGEEERIRTIVHQSNLQLGQRGLYTPELYDEILAHLENYRSQQKEEAEQVSEGEEEAGGDN